MRLTSGASSKSLGVSPIIATLLLIAIAVVAAVILYAFVSGLVTNFTKGGPSTLVTGSGEMAVPGSTDMAGVLTVNIRNGGSQSISDISAVCTDPPFSTMNCGGLIFDYNGNPIATSGAPTTLLPVNQLGTGVAGVTASSLPGFTAGTSYQVELYITFVGGSTQIILISVPSTS